MTDCGDDDGGCGGDGNGGDNDGGDGNGGCGDNDGGVCGDDDGGDGGCGDNGDDDDDDMVLMVKLILFLLYLFTNSYIKTYLLPDRSRSGKRKSKVKKNTIHPVFDEIITVCCMLYQCTCYVS